MLAWTYVNEYGKNAIKIINLFVSISLQCLVKRSILRVCSKLISCKLKIIIIVSNI